MMNVPRRTGLGIAVAAALAIPALVQAQGFGLNEIGSCAIARGFAVTAGGCHDASTLYWNAAGATSLDGWSLLVGAADIAVNGQFEQDTTHNVYKTDIPHALVPHFFLNYHSPASRAAWGLAFYVPYGLTSQWGPEFPGVFSSQKAALATYYIQPTVAWKLNDRWSVGGGPIFAHSTVELIQALDLSSQFAVQGVTFGMLGIPQDTRFATARMKGSASGYGAQIAIQGHLNESWTMGLRAMAPITFKYDGANATFTQDKTGLILAANNPLGVPGGTPLDAVLAAQFQSGGALVAQKVSTKITHPGQVQLGFEYTGIKDWNFEGDYAWTGWSSFKELPVNFADTALSRTQYEDYNNTSAIRLSAEYLYQNSLRLRAGFEGVASAAPAVTVTPLLPEQDREYANFGFGLPIGSRWALDAAYSHTFTNGRRGRIVERLNRSLTADQLNSGVYSLSANIFSVSLKASY